MGDLIVAAILIYGALAVVAIGAVAVVAYVILDWLGWLR